MYCLHRRYTKLFKISYIYLFIDRTNNTYFLKDPPKRKKINGHQFSRFNLSDKLPAVLHTEDNNIDYSNLIDNRHLDNPVSTITPTTDHLKSNTDVSILSNKKDKTKPISDVIDRHNAQMANTDDSENSSEEKGYARKDRKPLPLIFNQSCSTSLQISNNDSSEDTCKETGSCNKCVYLGERETLRSFWDKCLYQCFKSKRCVAGEKPKRKYRKKQKTSILPTKKRKQLDLPLSCIDTKGTAVAETNKSQFFLYKNINI